MRFVFGLLAFVTLTAGVALAKDVGLPKDVAAIRASAHQQSPSSTTLGVHVAGNYALTEWVEGPAGGFAVFKRLSDERWKRIDSSGGATSVSDLVQHGVPKPIARSLCSGWGDASPCSGN